MVVYPNPTADFLTLKVEKTEDLIYQLFDMQGKLVKSNKIISNNTTIKVENLPKATYFLKVTDSNKVTKTFRIIKN